MESSGQSFEIGTERIVVLETSSGEIQARGREGSQVTVDCGETPCNIRREGGRVTVVPGGGGSDDICLQVPSDCDLVLHTVSGEIDVRNISGKLTVQTLSGDIRCQELQGLLHVHTVSGDVDLSDAQFEAGTLETVSGDIELQAVTGALTLQTKSGDIKGEQVLGTAQASTVSGDLSLRRSALETMVLETVSGDCCIESALAEDGDYRFRSVSGDLELRLPEDQRCTLALHSLSGDLECALRHETHHQGWGKQDIVINGGGILFAARTTSGDIRVKAAHDLPEPQTKRAQKPAEPAGRATRPLVPEPVSAPKPVSAPEPFALEDQPSEPPVDVAEQRMQVLKAIEEGRLSVSEGLQRLKALEREHAE